MKVILLLYNLYMSDKLVLGYWGIRGRGQVLRHLLCFTGQQFQQRIYKSPDQYSKDASTSIGCFPNLPYLKDGQFVFTETLGIARYIVRRAARQQLLGQSPEDEAKIDNFLYAFEDIIGPLMAMFFNKKVMDVKTGHYYKIKANLQRFDKYINGKEFVIGYVTIADFFLAEFSHYLQKLYPQEILNYKNILAVRNKIQNLQQVKSYYQRPGSILTPFLPPSSTALVFYWPGTQPKVPPQQKFTPKPKPQPSQSQKPQPSQPVQSATTEPSHPPTQPPSSEPEPQPQQTFSQQIQPYYPASPHRVAIISGSLSGNSPTNYFLQVITGLGHPAFQFEWCDISALEIHNQDIEDGTENVNALRGQVYECEGVIIGVAESHGAMTSVLTNAYNWLAPVLKEKPCGIVSIQSSQAQLRKAFDYEGIPYCKSAKLTVADASTFFNQEGSVSGNNLNRVVNFFNKFAQFLQTGA